MADIDTYGTMEPALCASYLPEQLTDLGNYASHPFHCRPCLPGSVPQCAQSVLVLRLRAGAGVGMRGREHLTLAIYHALQACQQLLMPDLDHSVWCCRLHLGQHRSEQKQILLTLVHYRSTSVAIEGSGTCVYLNSLEKLEHTFDMNDVRVHTFCQFVT
jgi:hypothetical protein